MSAMYEVATEHLTDKYGDGVLSADVRLMVEGQRGVGFGLGYVPPNAEARQVQGGPKVPGPWAYAFGHAAVIDTNGGSRREIDQAKADGRLIECQVGDMIVIDGFAFQVDFHRFGKRVDRENIVLVPAS